MDQLNKLFFPGYEKRLREELYKRLRPQFPTHPLLRNFIDNELSGGVKFGPYTEAMHEGKFCDECKEPSCCLATTVVYLTDEDIDRLTKKGHRNFFREVEDDEGHKYMSIKRCAPCQFLKKGRCTIYNYRPNVCWRYPMQVTADTNKPVFNLAADCCIAFNITRQQIVDAIRKTDVLI